MGTNYLAPTWRQPENTNKDKLSNYSIDFPSSGDEIEVDGTSLQFSGSTSFSIWFKMDGSRSDVQRNIVGKGIEPNLSFFIRVHKLDGNYKVRFQIQVSSGAYISIWSTTSPTVTPDVWHHTVGVFDVSNNELKLYYDGAEVSGSPVSLGGATDIKNVNTNLRLGLYETGAYPFYGQIGQFCIFDYALTDGTGGTTNQIEYLYNLNNPMAISGAEPIAYYPLGDNSNPIALAGYPNISVGADSVFDFSGTNPNQIEIPASTDFVYNNNDFSISTWFYKTGTSQEAIFSKGSAGNGNHFLLFFNNTTTLRADFYNSAATGDFSFVFSNNQWYHILLTRNSSGSVTLYVNGGVGETITPDYADGNISNSTGYIGKYWAQTGMNFQGQLSNFQIYNSVLTQSNAETLYNYGVPLMTGTQPQAANLKAWYKLNKSANWEADSTGNWQIPDALSSYPQSFNFNDTTDAINVGGISLGTVHTINFWVNFKPPYGTRAAYILSSGSENGWVVYANNGGTLYYKAGSSQYFSGTMTAPTAAGVGEWHNITITRNGANINFYQNGNTTPFATTSTFAGASTPLGDIDFISADRSYGSSIRYSNFTFYDTEFSPSQVSQIYNNGVPLTSAIATSNLKAWYRLNNNELFDGTNWSVENQAYPAGFNSALDFVKSEDDYVECSSNTSLDTGDLSASIWVYADSGNSIVYMFDNSSALATAGFTFALNSNNTNAWYIGRATRTHIYVVNNVDINFQTNKWNHLCFSYNDTTKGFALYLNGVPVNSGTATASTKGASGNIRIGAGNNRVDYSFDGKLSNIAIFNTTLDLTAVQALYNNGTPETSISSSPVSWWKLNNLTTGIQDSVGSNDGTNNGATKVNTFVSTEAGISSGMTEQNLVNNNVSVLNGESSGMNTTNLVTSNLTKKQPFSSYSPILQGSDYFETTNGQASVLNGATSVSISAWVNFDSLSAQEPIVANWHSGSTQYLMRWINPSSGIQMYFNIDSTNVNAQFPITPTINAWYNVVGTWDGSTVKIYVNGVEGTPASGSGALNSVTTSNWFGAYVSSYRLNGELSNIAFWKNTALNQDDVLNIYNNGVTQDLNSFRVVPSAWYPFDQSYTYFNGSVLVARDVINGADANGINVIQENMVGNAPGSTGNGTGTNLTIADLKGNMYNSINNSYSINMADYADGVTNPANSGRSTSVPGN